MLKYIKKTPLPTKLFLVMALSILIVLIFNGDYIADEISSYYRFELNRLFIGDLSPLLTILKKGDHSPVYFALRAISFKLTGSLLTFRVLSLISFVFIWYFLRKILTKKGSSRRELVIFDFLLLLNPFLLYEVSISSKYIFMIFFLISGFYFDNLKEKSTLKTSLSIILAILTHYFSLFFITGYYFFKRDRPMDRKLFYIFLFFGVCLTIYLFVLLNSDSFVKGETFYISLDNSESAELFSLSRFISSIGRLFTTPQIYGSSHSIKNIELFSGVLILILFIYYIFKKERVSITITLFIALFLLISIYFQKSKNIIMFEATRFTYIIIPFIYLFIQFWKKNRFKSIFILIMLLFYLDGYTILFMRFPNELKIINEIIDEYPSKLYSYSPEYNGNFDEANLLKIKYKKEFCILYDRIEEKSSYILTNNKIHEFSEKNNKKLENIFYDYRIEKVFEGYKYSLYFLKRKIDENGIQ